MKENTFAIKSGSEVVGASILRGERGLTALFHHSKTMSLSDLVIQPHPEKLGEVRITAQGGKPIRTRSELERHWPTGWRCFKKLVEHIEESMQFREPYFSRAVTRLQ